MQRNELKNCFVNITNKEVLYANKVLKSQIISGKSPFVAEFEKKLTEYFNSKHAVTCTSGTSAIQMALYVFGVERGDEVMLPPTAPIMSVLPILSVGAVPVFVDLESNRNFNVSIQDINKKITPKTKVLINVPMWGYPNNSHELSAVCAEGKIYLLEDMSHCHGVRFSNGDMSGSIGDISIFSTHERKMITTGEGGFLLTDSDEFYEKLVKLRSFGTIGSYEYGENFGLNYRMSGINAAIGITQLKKLEKKIKQRLKNANYLLGHLKPFGGMAEVEHYDGFPNYYTLALIFKDYVEHEHNFSRYLYENHIISDTYAYQYKPLYKMPLLMKYKNRCPVADVMTKSIITLPTHEGLKRNDLDHIIKIFNEYKS